MGINGSGFNFAMFIPILLYILLLIALAVMFVYGFFLFVKFLIAGTKAFNIYIKKNNNSNLILPRNERTEKSE